MQGDSGVTLRLPCRALRVRAQGQPPDGTGRIRWRYILVPFVGGIAIVLLILALSLSLQVDIVPTGIKTLNVSLGPEFGGYDAFFALVDATNINGPASGYVYFKIIDANQTLLYNSEFQINGDDYGTYSNYTSGPPLIGYRWVIPLQNVTAGVPSSTGLGRAEFMFLPLSGGYVEGAVDVPIPQVLD